LPVFALTGGGGYGSFLLSTLTMPQSVFYNVTSNLILNVFVGGRRRVTLRMSFRFMDSPRYKLRKLLDPVYKLGRRLK
jgi:hypothetical protein